MRRGTRRQPRTRTNKKKKKTKIMKEILGKYSSNLKITIETTKNHLGGKTIIIISSFPNQSKHFVSLLILEMSSSLLDTQQFVPPSWCLLIETTTSLQDQ